VSTPKRSDPPPNPGARETPRAPVGDASHESPADYPILTEIVESATEPPTGSRNIGLEELERELRIELVNHMAADLEQQIESRVYGRLSASIEEIAGRVRNELFTEVRRAVREVVAEVLAEEKKRAQTGSPLPGRSGLRNR
jgi:hypothetical protein